ncbi:hypothetical protein [Rubritalea tangerina]
MPSSSGGEETLLRDGNAIKWLGGETYRAIFYVKKPSKWHENCQSTQSP